MFLEATTLDQSGEVFLNVMENIYISQKTNMGFFVFLRAIILFGIELRK